MAGRRNIHHTLAYTHLYTHTHTHAFVHTHTHTRICTHTHTHTHTHTAKTTEVQCAPVLLDETDGIPVVRPDWDQLNGHAYPPKCPFPTVNLLPSQTS